MGNGGIQGAGGASCLQAMGVEESKSQSVSEPPPSHHHQPEGADGGEVRPRFPNVIRSLDEQLAWSLLHECRTDVWKHGHAEAAGFHEKVITCDGAIFKDCTASFCTSRQGIINISRTGSIFSFRKRSKFARMAEHFEYNHIPAQMSSINNFRVRSVVCHREPLVILHLSRSNYSQFGLLDLRLNKFLGEFGKQRVDFVAEALVGEISPNKQHCLIRLPGLPAGGRRGVARIAQPDRFQLYDLRAKCQLAEFNLPPATSAHFTFDPRYAWRQLAIANFEPQQDNSVSIVRLMSNASSTPMLQTANSDARASLSSSSLLANSSRVGGSLPSTPANSGNSIHWQVVCTNSHVSDIQPTLYPSLKDLHYTSDGSLLVATLVEGPCNCREKRTRRDYMPVVVSVLVLDSDTLLSLHCIKYHRYTCALHLCPVNYNWLMSSCGSRMAVTLDKPGQPDTHYVQVYRLPQVMNLQNMCRVVIIQAFTRSRLLDLPLPPKLIGYLHFLPEYD